jgi:hypothetical protein
MGGGSSSKSATTTQTTTTQTYNIGLTGEQAQHVLETFALEAGNSYSNLIGGASELVRTAGALALEREYTMQFAANTASPSVIMSSPAPQDTGANVGVDSIDERTLLIAGVAIATLALLMQ